MKKILFTLSIVMLGLFAYGVSPQVETMAFDLTGAVKIWDVSGSYTDDLKGNPVSLTLAQFGNGQIRGDGSWSGLLDGNTVTASVSVKGYVKTSGSTTRVFLQILHKGKVSMAEPPGDIRPFSAVRQVKAEIDDSLLQIAGTARTTVSVGGLSNETLTEAWSLPLPVGMDGSGILEISALPGKKGKAGTAVLTLSNLEELSFRLNGKEKNDLQQFVLKGTGGQTSSASSSMKVSVEPAPELPPADLPVVSPEWQMTELKGKVLGQKVQYKGAPIPSVVEE